MLNRIPVEVTWLVPLNLAVLVAAITDGVLRRCSRRKTQPTQRSHPSWRAFANDIKDSSIEKFPIIRGYDSPELFTVDTLLGLNYDKPEGDSPEYLTRPVPARAVVVPLAWVHQQVELIESFKDKEFLPLPRLR
jgi:hypothetical protein